MNGTASMPQVQARVTGGCLQVALHELLSALNFVWIQTRQVSWTGLPLVEGRHVKSANILARYPGRNVHMDLACMDVSGRQCLLFVMHRL